MSEATIPLVDSKSLLTLFGTRDQHLRKIRDSLGVSVSSRNDRIHIEGGRRGRGPSHRSLRAAQGAGGALRGAVARRSFARPIASDGQVAKNLSIRRSNCNLPAGRSVRAPPARPATCDAIHDHDLVFCIGPAGTGKTYLAVAMAVQALKQEIIRKIVLVRPAVEAGESLGFLPGDLQAKINPYLRPLLDALARDDGLRPDQALHRTRPDRDDPAGLHARPHAERSLRHPGRSPEHDRGADEDVFDPHGPGHEDGGFRRHDASRLADAHPQRSGRRHPPAAADRGFLPGDARTTRTSCGTAWCRKSSRRTTKRSRNGGARARS